MNFDKRLKDHISSLSPQLQKALKERFKREGTVQIEQLVPSDIAAEMHAQAKRLLNENAKRRDLNLASTGNTPRHYRSVGRDVVYADNGIITTFFESEEIRRYLSNIADENLNKVPYEPEEYIINSQEKSGDTHGWHWDDYAFALIWVVDAPHPLRGGRIEYVNDTVWDKENPEKNLADILSSREVKRYMSIREPATSCVQIRHCIGSRH
ncbi:hypothetical protein [Phyllobacterium sp. P30BS-XVII]|uniref:HalD/BesD family halogenase n=1 Tax=Phyllobacterium sp. P30BS-XVII TaxID=2587046 RepID=UPI0015FC292C|nr:hypothetical protein [Phyllobacterium sp. P30BS-XVII]MBA8902085.1 hypothetical protein [Phyllobacterium sp. P30BS-XVII]